MHTKAFYWALCCVSILSSCSNSTKEFPLYRVDSVPRDHIQVGGIIADHFQQEDFQASAEADKFSFDATISDTAKIERFDVKAISADNLGESLESLISLANLYANTGDEKILEKVASGWRFIDENYISTTGDPVSKEVNNPNLLKKWLQLNSLMMKITGEPKYAADFENSIYNALMSENEPAASLGELTPYFYTRYLDQIYVNVFGSSSMQYDHTTGGSIRIVQETNYPYDGLVKFKFESDDKRYVELHIRIPEWAEKASLTVGGVKYKTVPGEYAQVTKKWETGDVAELILPMRPQAIEKQMNSESYFGLKYGVLDLATKLCDSVLQQKDYIFKGNDPYPNLRFVSPPGDVPTFTFDGLKDTTLVFQPYFLVKNSDENPCVSNWIPKAH